MHDIQNLLIELDKLKSVYRQSYLSDLSRNENSAEHSWHLAVALMALKDIIPETVNIDHAIRIALLHDVCEIGVGDISVYDAMRAEITEKEADYMAVFAEKHDAFGREANDVWHEYENQGSEESRWVKVVDRLLPFILNIATEGKSWQEQGIRRSQVLALNSGIADISPELYKWIKNEIDGAVQNGWLLDA
jgi:putative hydrolase of HD superfamily